MIVTLHDDKKRIVINRLVARDGAIKEIEHLHSLYSKPNFELGYLQHGGIWFHREKPEEVLITKDAIKVFDSYKWGENGINNLYPVENFTTKAKNTLIMIRQLLGLEYDDNFKLKSFFTNSSKEVDANGFLADIDFNSLTQTRKLEHILANKEIALSLLKDAYLDFSLFAGLLTRVDLEMQIMEDPALFEFFHPEAVENTPLLNFAKEFAKLKQKQINS